MPRNIVVLSFTRMGDLIQSTPLLRALRTANPNARLTLVVLKTFEETAKRLPMIDHVIAFDVDRFVSSLDRMGSPEAAHDELHKLLENPALRDIDLLINLSHTRQSATLSALLKPASFVGMHRDTEGNLRVQNDWIVYLLSIMEERRFNPFNLVEIYRHIAGGACTDLNLEMILSQEDARDAEELFTAHGLSADRDAIALQPGASHPSRCWPVERYADLATRFIQDGFQVVVLGDESESKLAERLCELSDNQVISIAGKTSVGSLSGVLAHCKLLITNDTGTAHIAAALKIPVIGIFLGPASAKDTAPMGNNHVILEADLPCAPCDYKKTCANPVCKSVIEADAVYKTAKSVLNHQLHIMNLPVGVKGSLTRVDEEGQFRLLRTDVAESYADELLDFYRSFWSSFLHHRRDHKTPCATVRVKHKLRPGILELRSICNEAGSAVDELNRLNQTVHDSSKHARDTLVKQAVWQNRLRSLIIDYPEVSPLCRFLLVKAVLARTSGLSHYREDLTEIVSDLNRSVILLEAMASEAITQTASLSGELVCAES